jgi:hypothetical protein
VPGQDDQEQDENRKPPGLKRGCRFLSTELKSFVRMASVLHDFITLQLWQHCQYNGQLRPMKLCPTSRNGCIALRRSLRSGMGRPLLIYRD